MPATRIGRTVIFPGGQTVTLSQWERLMFKLGVHKTMRRPPTWQEQRDCVVARTDPAILAKARRWWEYPW